MKTLGNLVRLDPKDVWIHEAHEFTPWLLVNIGVLGEALGIDLEEATAEVAVGDFAVDIEARTSGPDARPVIIENQLAQIDHTHLGQLITYARIPQLTLTRVSMGMLPLGACAGGR
ncbi:MAG: hypothetical protein ACC726_11660 [Chloroflexota bacterium]